MSESILVAIITGGLSLMGVVFTSMVTSKKQEQAAAVAQAVMDTKIDELTREVREHNNFAQKMPAFEQRINDVERRVDNLEQYHKGPTN
jgi:TolA-binding protein